MDWYFGMVSTWKKKERKTSKFVVKGSNDCNEREKVIWNMKWIDMEECRKKIKLYAQEYAKTLILCRLHK